MEQFSLEKWLKDKSRKVVTRDGREVRIICWDAKDSKPIVALVSTRSISRRQFDELTVGYFNDGTYYGGAQDDFLDLFFEDEEPKTIEVPFGAKDSEFVKDEYSIPEGCEARIEGNKVIIEKKKVKQLTEFEKAIKLFVENNEKRYKSGYVPTIADIKTWAAETLDLARKELQPEFDKEMDKLLAETDKVVYQKGREDALKDLPKWKKCIGSTGPFIEDFRGEDYLYLKDYVIKVSELEKLPKEE